MRVNLCALALLALWKEPLLDVLRREVMGPIGASGKWEWHGYRNSWTDTGGQRLQAVPGGSHWGGGIWIATADQIRMAELVRRNGDWNGKTVLPASWIAAIRTPCGVFPQYGS